MEEKEDDKEDAKDDEAAEGEGEEEEVADGAPEVMSDVAVSVSFLTWSFQCIACIIWFI